MVARTPYVSGWSWKWPCQSDRNRAWIKLGIRRPGRDSPYRPCSGTRLDTGGHARLLHWNCNPLSGITRTVTGVRVFVVGNAARRSTPPEAAVVANGKDVNRAGR
jgi:hypothetical protein